MITEEILEKAQSFIGVRQSKDCITIEDKLKLYSKSASEFLRLKYISPTIFESDKRLIEKVIYIRKNQFSIITKENQLFATVTFEQLQSLVEIGASQEDESDFVENNLFIVK